MNKKGFVALSTILIVTVVMMSVVATVAYLAIGEGQTSLALELGDDNLHFVEGCVEDLLLDVRDNSAYSAASITRPEGTCNYTYNLSGPTNWDVTVSTNSTEYQRKIRVVFTRGASITLTSWQEI